MNEEVKPEVVGQEDKPGPLAIASLVTGIVGIVIWCIPVGGWIIGLGSAIAAIVTGAKEKKKIQNGESSAKGKGMATAGLIMGIIAVAFAVLGLISLIIWGVAGLFSAWSY
jgi:hypothetical protein